MFATGGDGFAAAFGRAADAVAAAEEAQTAMAGLDLLRVRMGINTGEAQERDGDYFGPAVNRSARLMSAGHGGQVLIAAVTAGLVPGLVLRNLGEHQLRDLSSPMLVWQLGTGDFPPLRTLDAVPGNLPVQRTSFVGRVDEVKELTALVGTERLVTLTGSGGVGKSRLALQVAAEAASAFADGVWFAPLAPLEEGPLAAATLLESLGVPERQGESALDTLCAWAGSHEALVVIDNCEHLLVEVASVVDRLIESSTGVSVLATSQAPLGVRGEHVWAVAPLSGHRGVAQDSMELFVDRARMARADFDLSDDNAAAVAEICERLDHVPLAIELAAARVRGLTPADIARRLDQRLRLLTSSDRLAPGRHQTLDAAVRWSYELLDDPQQRVFDRLSVFAGGFTIEAAEGVVAGDGVDDWDVLDGILALVDKSLVIADEGTGGSRYRLLETMRQFGQANLADTGTLELHRQRHSDAYTDYVLSRRPQLQGSGDITAAAEVESELDNIRVTLRRAADDHQSSRFENLFSSMFTIWMRSGRSSEGASWAAELQHRPDLDPHVQIVALGNGAQVTMSWDMPTADAMADRANRLWDTTRASPPLNAVAVLGLLAVMQGAKDTAVACCDRVVSLADNEPDLFVRCQALVSCYATLATCGELARLDDVDDDMRSLLAQLDNRYLDANAASALAPIVHVTDPDGAGEHLRQAVALAAEAEIMQSHIAAAMFLALHELRTGDSVAAATWARRSLQLAVDHGPTHIAPITNTTVAILKGHSPAHAAELLGGLRAHRARRHQTGTQTEIDGEERYEASLRRRLDDQFEASYERGLALDEAEMIALAFSQLDAVTAASDGVTADSGE